MPITHAKVSAVPDSVATGLVQPSEWNAAHVIGALGTPAADGIAFPASQVPAAGVNVLDDYEEGTWTPVVTFATPGDLSVAYSRQVGRYTKIGRLVIVHIDISTSTFTFTSASGDLTITGLPFASASAAGGYAGPVTARIATPLTNTVAYQLHVDNAATTARILASRTSAASALIGAAQMTTAINPEIRATGIYHV